MEALGPLVGVTEQQPRSHGTLKTPELEPGLPEAGGMGDTDLGKRQSCHRLAPGSQTSLQLKEVGGEISKTAAPASQGNKVAPGVKTPCRPSDSQLPLWFVLRQKSVL